MNFSSLSDLISMIELGTNLHISIVFLSDFGNEKTMLPFKSTIHSKPVCDSAKLTSKGYKRCFMCRNIALKKAATQKESFGGLCINGIYEYCRPVILESDVIAVVFVGNIYSDNPKISKFDSRLTQTLQKDFTFDDCKKIADLIESYILLLAKEYPKPKNITFNPLIENIKHYIEENLNYNFSISNLSQIFGYNEKYLGRVFKKYTGITITEYTNNRRVEEALPLIESTNIPFTEIALRAGYNNVTYFNRVFKTHTGKTPTEMRKKRFVN